MVILKIRWNYDIRDLSSWTSIWTWRSKCTNKDIFIGRGWGLRRCIQSPPWSAAKWNDTLFRGLWRATILNPGQFLIPHPLPALRLEKSGYALCVSEIYHPSSEDIFFFASFLNHVGTTDYITSSTNPVKTYEGPLWISKKNSPRRLEKYFIFWTLLKGT